MPEANFHQVRAFSLELPEQNLEMLEYALSLGAGRAPHLSRRHQLGNAAYTSPRLAPTDPV
jgi:hypothetical protein